MEAFLGALAFQVLASYVVFGVARAFGASTVSALTVAAFFLLLRLIFGVGMGDYRAEQKGMGVAAAILTGGILIAHALWAARSRPALSPRLGSTAEPLPPAINEDR